MNINGNLNRVIVEFLIGFFTTAATSAATLTVANGAVMPSRWSIIVAALGSIGAAMFKVQAYLAQPKS